MKIVQESEILTVNNKFQQVFILSENNNYYTSTTWWIKTKDGFYSKVQTSEPTLVVPKNIGKSNETTPEGQAFSEYKSIIEKLKQKNYRFLSEDNSKVFLPMLAKQAVLEKLRYPVYTQHKLDGTRAIQSNGLMASRKGKQYLEKVVSHLIVDLPSNLVLDGELILPKPYTFQQSMSAIKRFNAVHTPKLEFHVYDLYDYNQPDLKYLDRLALLKTLALNPSIKICPTDICHSLEEIKETFNRYILEGYEGLMVRLNGSYDVNKRSSSLLKYKEFIDSEFKVVDVIAGEGSHSTLGIFVCVTAEGKEFKAMLAGSAMDKTEILINKNYYISKMLTVKYQELTTDGIPRFPIALKLKENFE